MYINFQKQTYRENSTSTQYTSFMNSQERLDLKRLINSQDYVDNTEGIRRVKHSDLLKAEIQKMELLKTQHAEARENAPKSFETLCMQQCSFLYNSYMDIFNRLLKDELDLGLMSQALVTLKKIEDGEIDQQEGSVLMGKILHRVFVESAMKKSEHLDAAAAAAAADTTGLENQNHGKTVSWKEFKSLQMKKRA